MAEAPCLRETRSQARLVGVNDDERAMEASHNNAGASNSNDSSGSLSRPDVSAAVAGSSNGSSSTQTPVPAAAVATVNYNTPATDQHGNAARTTGSPQNAHQPPQQSMGSIAQRLGVPLVLAARNQSLAPAAASPHSSALPQHATTAFPHMPAPPPVQPQAQPQQPSPSRPQQPQQQQWSVPNPLGLAVTNSPPRPPRPPPPPPPQQAPSTSSPTAEELALQQQRQIAAQQHKIQMRQQQLQHHQQALQQQQMLQHQHQALQQQQQRQQQPTAQQPPSQQMQQQQPGLAQPQRKPKIALTPNMKEALTQAIWSAIKDPHGKVDPQLMAAAVQAGLPEHAIMNAARVAREKDAQKQLQKSQQQQQQQGAMAGAPVIATAANTGVRPPPQQELSAASTSRLFLPPKQQQRPLPTSMMQTQQHQAFQPPPIVQRPTAQPQQHQQQHHVPNAAQVAHQQQALYQQQHQRPHQQQKQALLHQQQQAAAAAAAAHQQLSKQRQQQQQQQQQSVNQEADAKNRERYNWKRIQHGTFMNPKGGRFLAVPYSIGGMVRTKDLTPALEPLAGRKRPAADMYTDAIEIQKLVKARKESGMSIRANAPTNVAPLLDPAKYKRVKIEPKKYAKALDRAARKSRQAIAEGLTKQHKELCKALSSHQSEFFKFHRQRKADALKLAKTIRDSFDKEEKKKEKDVAQQERARLAALKANDMTAYSKLLEETKNERLQYLLEKTEKHFSQISSLLQNQRATEHGGTVKEAADTSTSSYYSSAHSLVEEVRQPTILVGGDLKEYQLAGLQWLVSLYNNRLNGILADEMGLGKTIQAISVIAYLMEFKQNLGPYLVIVPLSTLSNWQNEFARWCPAARTVCYKGTKGIRKQIFKDHVEAGQFNVLLTTYEYIIKDKKFLKRLDWQYAIVDEGHRMKNAESKFAVTLGTQYSTKYRVLLTGTPLMNDLSELWSLLNFLLPAIFNSSESFDSWFSAPFAQFSGSNQAEEEGEMLLSNEERVLIIHRLHELLRPFMLRRVKSEVLDQLPEKVEKVLRCELSSWQKELYRQISYKAVADSGALGLSGAPVPSRGLNNIVMQLRKVCNHPFLFSPEGYHINDKLIRSSGKFALLDQMLPKLKLAGHRVLIFTQMTAVMNVLDDYFAYRGFLSLRLDGSTPAEEREKRMYKFNSPDSPYFIFLLSTRAGGLGLNLTAADTVIIFDSDWNPAMDQQAQDRAHRIGQRSDVSVFRLITYSAVEEQILARATEKLNVAELVVESGQFTNDSVENDTSMERKRLMEVLMTDFDKSHPKGGPSEKSSDNGDEEDDDSAASDKDDPNELLSNNEADYQLYTEFDERREREGNGVPALFTEDADIPDWIRNPMPPGTKNSLARIDDGPRKRKEVAYDDGLTERQFVRLMDKQAVDEETAKAKAKAGRSPNLSMVEDSVGDQEILLEGESSDSNLTDWTFRKLISCTKTVVALKDPSTKRRLADIFLEKPDPATFPDYYEVIDRPIAINDILRKCRAKIYTNIPEYREDWNLMFANARRFNGEDSWVVVDALALEKELERVLKKNGFSDGTIPVGKKKKLRIKLSLKDIKKL